MVSNARELPRSLPRKVLKGKEKRAQYFERSRELYAGSADGPFALQREARNSLILVYLFLAPIGALRTRTSALPAKWPFFTARGDLALCPFALNLSLLLALTVC